MRLAAVALLALAGCRNLPPRAPEAAPAPGAYEVESGRDAATVARMRAAPAPATPELVRGTHAAGDRSRLLAQGFVPIGHARFPGDEASARNAAIRQGRTATADRILLYPPAPGTSTGAGEPGWLAVYYVRFQLPFGASFRDLRAQERATLGVAGGVAIGSVVAGTPASRANLLTGDFVVKFDGKALADRAAFQRLLQSRAGHPVTLTIVRNGVTLQRAVRLGSLAGDAER